MKKLKNRLSIDRIESVYLAILRIAVLTVATISLIAAAGFALDGLWRFAVVTDVKQEPTAVAPAEVIAAMKMPPPAAERGDAQIPAHVRAAHAEFSSKVFSVYYSVYRKASEAYKKSEDTTLTQAELMSALGYDLETYASGEVPATKLFVENTAYQQQAQTAVAAAMADATALGQLQEYKAAQKTAQSCTTEYERRTMWDSNSTACSDWFYQPYGCNVTRSVPVQRCVAAYPEGIVSPTVAFGRADDAFRVIWAQRAEANAQAAADKRYAREETRSKIGPRLMLALQIIGGFLVVMFFFLLIAVERHLRRVAEPTKDALVDTDESVAPKPAEPTDPASDV
ncbi:hypothetical protein [Brevundimonas sp.]|jgi:hypothetical protein|uniref:hypothetical protein n=1 Tax=Brevundimonas sp. TaxID=1871086 RepID=UPI0037834169